MVDERTIELKAGFNDVILRIQHKTGAIDLSAEYLVVIKILIGAFVKQLSITNSEAVIVSDFIKYKELYYKSL
ncbi:MAG: hypothetical protein Q9M43_12660 [Sulfurimonas sp.]|nr:hypothetical protein [Sulfurimonas sp.]